MSGKILGSLLESEFARELVVVGNVRDQSFRIRMTFLTFPGKRRKIKCQLSSEDVPVCAGCLARGTTCLSQEYPEEREPSNNTQIGERLGRVEMLLETLVNKITAYEADEKADKEMMTPQSMLNGDVLTPHPSNAPNSTQEATPYMSLFDNPVVSLEFSFPVSYLVICRS